MHIFLHTANNIPKYKCLVKINLIILEAVHRDRQTDKISSKYVFSCFYLKYCSKTPNTKIDGSRDRSDGISETRAFISRGCQPDLIHAVASDILAALSRNIEQYDRVANN